jgi:hypothetical protein
VPVDRAAGKDHRPVDAFDADVLIEAVADHGLGRRARALFPVGPLDRPGPAPRIGSVLLVPELLGTPLRDQADGEMAALGALRGRTDLLAVDQAIAELATALGASDGLRAIDPVRLATAGGAAADRFITDNRADFSRSIADIAITDPDDLSDPAEP